MSLADPNLEHPSPIEPVSLIIPLPRARGGLGETTGDYHHD